ncbi:uncharacterized protein N7459_002774 [Penicillium hispanicum]|uniref:uncharacterized protein n=1 Tax=Penicillium hispanicum TaxID=1080232 RepID=UPI00254044A0|nr:uncharacterized protein N7459_002774 [Penicillium hispanicum]KAJ5587009.1 hypothetical protein N7459_002774 [Penicillium hispanicum]
MDAENSQKHFDRLARVRENQRKSRARKLEHVRDLEQRLATCKEQVQSKDIQHRLAMQKVEAENRHLRSLLGSLGVPESLVQQYIQLADQGTAIHRKIAIPAMQQPNKRSSTAASDKTDLRPSCAVPKTSDQTPIPPQEIPLKENTKMSADNPPSDSKPAQQVGPGNPRLCSCPTESGALTSFPSEGDVLNSTLCAIAEELVSQYNTRGADLEGIKRKLWPGFRAGNTGDGCRVQNQVLFQVLDEISNSI